VVDAAMNVNVWDVVDDLKAIITAGRPVDPVRLVDPAIEIGDLVGAASH
jgi:3-phenylpropionate/trans-cinnamate dioxygenase ferredoxin reductase component